MAIKDKSELPDKIQIDLSGPQGNVFFLIGTAQKFARQLGLDGKAILEDMQSADYEHAVNVFEENFGDYVDLYR